MEKLKQTRRVVDGGMTQFSDLPSCLVMDIPITTLVTCSCVCKDWIRLFQEPYFIKLQAAASPMHILTVQDEPEEDVTFQFGQIMEDKGTQDLEERIVNLRRLKLPVPVQRDGGIDSCNGLLLFLEDVSKWRLCVCNPILGEWVSISTPPVRDYSHFISFIDLVFSAKNNQYKLLHGLENIQREEDDRFEIYTLGGTGQWRTIDTTLTRFPGGFFHYEYDHIVLHGSVHWIDPDAPSIYFFDVDNEKFRRLPLPMVETDSHDRPVLGEINGCLCVHLFSEYKDSVEIWAMKEYGEVNSWMMMLTFDLSSIDDDDWIGHPIRFVSPNEGEILMPDNRTGQLLRSCNLRRKRFSHSRLKSGCFEALYKPSFISLKEVAKGEEVMLYQNHAVEGGGS